MSTFHPSKLSVNVIPPANFLQPVQTRKYTLTHSDETGELFLDIGYVYNYSAIDWSMRDEVLAEWRKDAGGHFRLVGSALVDIDEYDKKVSDYRFKIFKKEMSTAIKGMVLGDLPFLKNYPPLLDAPIFIQYESIYPEYRVTLFHGTPRQYLNEINNSMNLIMRYFRN